NQLERCHRDSRISYQCGQPSITCDSVDGDPNVTLHNRQCMKALEVKRIGDVTKARLARQAKAWKPNEEIPRAFGERSG
ncbi:hypothetical protein HAX54_001826, partial [Datura stramonium]|nr:hypothetical protein [Datura stramonium]